MAAFGGAALSEAARNLSSLRKVTGVGYFYTQDGATGDKPYMVYVFDVASAKGQWRIYRRYRQFDALARKLKSKPALPEKGSMFFHSTKNNAERVDKRYEGLRGWLVSLFEGMQKTADSMQRATSSVSLAQMRQIYQEFDALYTFLTQQTVAPRPIRGELNTVNRGSAFSGDDDQDLVARVGHAERQLLQSRKRVAELAQEMHTWMMSGVAMASQMVALRRAGTGMPLESSDAMPNLVYTDRFVLQWQQNIDELADRSARLQVNLVKPLDELCTWALPKIKEAMRSWAEHSATLTRLQQQQQGGGRSTTAAHTLLQTRDEMKEAERTVFRRLQRLTADYDRAMRLTLEQLCDWQSQVFLATGFAAMPSGISRGRSVSMPHDSLGLDTSSTVLGASTLTSEPSDSSLPKPVGSPVTSSIVTPATMSPTGSGSGSVVGSHDAVSVSRTVLSASPVPIRHGSESELTSGNSGSPAALSPSFYSPNRRRPQAYNDTSDSGSAEAQLWSMFGFASMDRSGVKKEAETCAREAPAPAAFPAELPAVGAASSDLESVSSAASSEEESATADEVTDDGLARAPFVTPMAVTCPEAQWHHSLGIRYGLASSRGVRSAMEDRSTCDIRDNVAFFGVYDGHNGEQAAQYLESHLHTEVFKQAPTELTVRTALETAFATTDRALLDGVLVITASRLVIAHLGDCEAVLSDRNSISCLCRRHRPLDPAERKRVEHAGGRVIDGRIFGMLGVSRAFGDIELKTSHGQYSTRFNGDVVSAEPEVTELSLRPTQQFLVLGCDGLFDYMPATAVVEFIKTKLDEHGDVQRAAEELVDAAIHKHHSRDNVSVIIVVLQQH